jgi:hypothetical protein
MTAGKVGTSTPVLFQNSAATGSIEAASIAARKVFHGGLGIIEGNSRMMTAIHETPAGVPTA